MASPNVGLTEQNLLELVSLAFDQPHRTDVQQEALENACAKIDRRWRAEYRRTNALDPHHPLVTSGGLLHDAIETRCPNCKGGDAAPHE